MRFILYARKSTDREDRQIQSIPDQLRLLHELAQKHRLAVIREISESRSAKVPHTRPGFGEMIRALSAGEADGILCWTENRLFRNQLEYGIVQQMLQDRIIEEIRTIERVYRPEDNVLLLAVAAGLATQFSRDLSRDTLRGLITRREAGWYTSRVPEGYINNRQHRRVDIDPERFSLLQEAWQLMLSGAYSVPKVLEFLNSRRYMLRRTACRGGRPLRRNILYKIFTNPFYAGYFVIQGQRYEGAHEPMISEEEFNRVQAILRGRTAPQVSRPNLLFSGIIRCAPCGGLITGERKVKHYPKTGNTRIYTYYHCNGYRGCSKACTTEEAIEEEVTKLFESLKLCPVVNDWVDGQHVETPEPLVQKENSDWRLKKQQAHLLRAKLKRVQEMREEEEISRSEFEQRKHDLYAELLALEDDMRRIEAEAKVAEDALHEAKRYLREELPRYTDLTGNEKRPLIIRLGDFFLTLNGLNVRLDPLLKKMLLFGLAETGSASQKCDGLNTVRPVWYLNEAEFLSEVQSGGYRFPSLPRSNKGSLTAEELRDVGVPVADLVRLLRGGTSGIRVEGLGRLAAGPKGLLEVVDLQDRGGKLLGLERGELDAVELKVEGAEGLGAFGAGDGESHGGGFVAGEQPVVREMDENDSVAA